MPFQRVKIFLYRRQEVGHISQDLASKIRHRSSPSNSCLKVTVQCHICYAPISTAGVFLIHSPKFGSSGAFLSKHGPCNWRNFFLTIVGIFQESRTPRIAPHRSTSNVYCGCSKLTWKVVKQVVTLKCSIQNVT